MDVLILIFIRNVFRLSDCLLLLVQHKFHLAVTHFSLHYTVWYFSVMGMTLSKKDYQLKQRTATVRLGQVIFISLRQIYLLYISAVPVTEKYPLFNRILSSHLDIDVKTNSTFLQLFLPCCCCRLFSCTFSGYSWCVCWIVGTY